MSPKQRFEIWRRTCATAAIMCLALARSYGQGAGPSPDSLIGKAASLSDKGLRMLSNRYELLQKEVEKQATKALQRMQKKEEELQKKLWSIDSNRSKQLFAETKARYEKLKQELASPAPLNNSFAQKARAYVPALDSVQTSLKLLEQKELSLPDQKMAQLQALSSRIALLQSRLQAASQVQQYLQQREQLLKQKLSDIGAAKQLLSINKEAYYYQQRLLQYKAMLSDKEKIKQAVIAAAIAQPAFQRFWQKHSMLASIFPMPENMDGTAVTSAAGLQAKAEVNSLIQQKLGKALPSAAAGSANGSSAQSYLQQQVQQAKSELDQLKDKLMKLKPNNTSSSDITMPDFEPNGQKTKTFLKRLEYGFSMQNAPSSAFVPATSDIAVVLGYKLSDKATVGIGAAYLLGWGAPVKDIHFTSQGMGLRSYLDIKAKGSFWLTGGLELNYMQGFSSIPGISSADLWQKSALVGLTKKVKLGNKTANLQALYDLLAAEELPRGQALKFRVGYTF